MLYLDLAGERLRFFLDFIHFFIGAHLMCSERSVVFEPSAISEIADARPDW
jgi:hypothetical protein